MLTNKIVQNNILNTFKSNEEFSDLFVLFGTLNKNTIISSINIIESKLKELNYKKTIISRAKLISIELLENILKHQKIETKHQSFFEVGINKNEIVFKSGNSVNKNSAKKLSSNLKNLTLKNTNAIKELYLERLRNGKLDEKGNAGLGILTILKRSNQKYSFEINPINNSDYYFSNAIKIII